MMGSSTHIFTMHKRAPRFIRQYPFLFITPAGNARLRANLSCIQGHAGNFIFIDCGSPIDPGNAWLKKLFQKYSLAKAPAVSLLITHSHLDHVANYWWFQRQFSQVRAYTSDAESPLVTYPYHPPPYWDRISTMTGSPAAINFLRLVVMMIAIPKIFGRSQIYNPVTYKFTQQITSIKVEGRLIEALLTPGHSPGHCAYLDETKYLFLGDLVPGTPWLDPAPNSLELMIASIQKLLRIPDRKVEFAVRSHCNANDHGRFIYPWSEERARFESFLARILATLDRIPAFLRGRVLSTLGVGREVFKNVNGYLTFMNRLWVPPALTWVVGYLSYLEHRGTICRISRCRNQIAWTS